MGAMARSDQSLMSTTSRMCARASAAEQPTESAKADVPALPVTVEEVAAAARDCQAVGAAVIHLHVRDTDAQPTLDLGRVREVVAAVRESSDLVLQLSTGGAVTDPFDSAPSNVPSKDIGAA